MKEKGFEMIDFRKEEITFEHAKYVLTALGKYHALSFALRDKCPEKFKYFSKNLQDVLFDDNNEFIKVYFDSFKPLIYGTLRENEEELRKKLENIFEKSVFDAAKQCVEGSYSEPYAIVCHGDCWTNNILYKYDEVFVTNY